MGRAQAGATASDPHERRAPQGRHRRLLPGLRRRRRAHWSLSLRASAARSRSDGRARGARRPRRRARFRRRAFGRPRRPARTTTTQRSPASGTRWIRAVMRPRTTSPLPAAPTAYAPGQSIAAHTSSGDASEPSMAPHAAARDLPPARRRSPGRRPRRGRRTRSTRGTRGCRCATCRTHRVLGGCKSDRGGRVDRPARQHEPLRRPRRRRAGAPITVPLHGERTLERRRKAKRDLDRVGIEERGEAARRISAVRRRQRSAETAWKGELHPWGL